MPDTARSADAIAQEIITRTGGDIRLALPLGLGKPVTLVNALTRAVADRPETRLSILTALTLERPDMSEGMAQRFLEPAADRLFGRYPALDYADRLRAGTLPDNIEVSEFFMQAGRWIGVRDAQRRYIPANYTHAYNVLSNWHPNVLMQLLAPLDDTAYSLSCNTDISADLLRERREGQQDFLIVGEINENLPAMDGPEARLPRDEVQLCLDTGDNFDLFSVVKRPVGRPEHAIGLHVARTIPDGGTLQIGIGAIGDAVAHALMRRQKGQLSKITETSPFATDAFGEHGPFDTGLYAVTEMLVDGLLQLFEQGIIRRKVDGAAIHAGFFVDCRDFYARLRALPAEQRAQIHMMPVSFTNQLYGDEPAKRDARIDARFVNSAMKATLLGGIVSDITTGAQEVSGIGGQFNFIEQAFALDGGRALITLPSTRTKKGETVSNIVWEHPHESVPRPYRDIIVTEYGIADLRGQRDEVAIARMLAITDSRFQDDLLEKARSAGKVAKDFTIDPAWRANTPDNLAAWLAPHDLPDFPFGTDFDAVERRILPALGHLSATQGHKLGMARLVLSGITAPKPTEEMARMGMDAPGSLKSRLEAWALAGALLATATDRA
ncbi:MAG: acetyl-CoA hydrolase/transferase C-terminal domain-containing protein [Roseovarius sp.]